MYPERENLPLFFRVRGQPHKRNRLFFRNRLKFVMVGGDEFAGKLHGGGKADGIGKGTFVVCLKPAERPYGLVSRSRGLWFQLKNHSWKNAGMSVRLDVLSIICNR